LQMPRRCTDAFCQCPVLAAVKIRHYSAARRK
jgi:hypothetical protein